MPDCTAAPDRTELAPGLGISRVVTGLWQVADMERGGEEIDPDAAAAELGRYAEAGFDSFDMADHYGSAEVIDGRFNRLVAAGSVAIRPGTAPASFTKWCPTPGEMTPAIVRAAVERARERMQVDTLDLMQFHWWSFDHPAYLDALRELRALKEEGLIRHLGLTNFNTDHLRLVVKHGIPIASNQVSFSLLDRRASQDMATFCLGNGVKLLAYGTLAGGLLSEKWLGRSEPPASEIADWSKSKYKRFVDQTGGWPVLQRILHAVAAVGQKHGVSLPNVASRWVLEQPAVAAVIIGARLGEREHRDDNLRLFSFALDAEDHRRIDEALAGSRPIPGDCGDEYRRPPFLTASGDLSHHLQSMPKYYRADPVPERPDRMRVDSGSIWEPVCGYSRAMRIGNRVFVSGTTATHGSGEVVCPGDAHGQAVYILDKIGASLQALGASIEDVVRTRIFVRDVADWEPVARVHGRLLGHVRPANTLVQASLIGDYLVEIEAEAALAG